MDEFEIRLADVTDPENVPALEAEMAGLSDFEQAQVLQHLEDRPPSSTADVSEQITQAQHAEDAMLEAQRIEALQEQKIAEGDLHGAKSLGDDREFYLHEAEAHGASIDATVLEAQHDTSALDWAAYHDDIAQGNADSAAAYAAEGDADHAALYADTAASHAETSASYVDTTVHDTSASSISTTTVDTSHTDG